MNVTIKQPEFKEKPKYPKLMHSSVTGNIYLMTDECSGTCVHVGDTQSGRTAGRYYDNLSSSVLSDFEGSIELSN